MRLNRLPHGFTRASLRCLCAMDPESFEKALQDCLRALGTGQGADPSAAPAPQAAARIPWAGAVVTAQDRVHASSSFMAQKWQKWAKVVVFWVYLDIR